MWRKREDSYDAWGHRLPGGGMVRLGACYDGMSSTIFLCVFIVLTDW